VGSFNDWEICFLLTVTDEVVIVLYTFYSIVVSVFPTNHEKYEGVDIRLQVYLYDHTYN